jgi:hypothetical protein
VHFKTVMWKETFSYVFIYDNVTKANSEYLAINCPGEGSRHLCMVLDFVM